MDELTLRTALQGSRFADVSVVASIDSTNRALINWAVDHTDVEGRSFHDGSVLIARSQTAGRGRLGRSWVAPPDSALLMSVLLHTSALPLDRWPLLSFAMGLAVVDATAAISNARSVGLKWPNDVVIENPKSPVGYRKLAGILAESSMNGPNGGHVVVGVGVNLFRPETLDPALGPEAVPTWLNEHGMTSTAEDFTVRLLQGFAGHINALTKLPRTFMDAYRARCLTLGRHVTANLGDRSLTGVATDVDAAGHLLVSDTNNHAHILSAGDVVHLRPSSDQQKRSQRDEFA